MLTNTIETNTNPTDGKCPIKKTIGWKFDKLPSLYSTYFGFIHCLQSSFSLKCVPYIATIKKLNFIQFLVFMLKQLNHVPHALVLRNKISKTKNPTFKRTFKNHSLYENNVYVYCRTIEKKRMI